MFIRKVKAKIKSYFVSPHIYKENSELLSMFASYKKGYLLGSSPSINKYDLSKLGDDVLKISMGNFYEHHAIDQIKPSIHIFAASHPPITKKVLMNWWERCDNKLPMGTPVLVERRDSLVAHEVFKNRKVFEYSYGGTLPVDFTKKIMSPWSVSIVGLQFAVYCSIEKTYLLGINHDWQCIQPYRHFYAHDKPSLEYYLYKEGIKISYEEQKQPFPKERLYREYELYQQYELLKKSAEENGCVIYNGDCFSHFDVFERDEQEGLLNNKQI